MTSRGILHADTFGPNREAIMRLGMHCRLRHVLGPALFQAVILPALCSHAAAAAPNISIGFTDPSDLAPLLEYRLPDWGYRTLGVRLELTGAGTSRSGTGQSYPSFDGARMYERVDLSWYRESEGRTWSVAATQSGRWNWTQSEKDQSRTVGADLTGGLDVVAWERRYVHHDLSLLIKTDLGATYGETRWRYPDHRNLSVQRFFDGSLEAGIGLGRLRDVTPLLQAQRLNERLRALGREPLSDQDVQSIASVLARAGGYRRVFDRPDRHLWRDVLEPLAGHGQSLSPFEVFYLREITVERLGTRREGLILDVSGRGSERDMDSDSAGGSGTTSQYRSLGPVVDLEWSHNLNLDHQISLLFSTSYTWWDHWLRIKPNAPKVHDLDFEEGVLSLTGNYLLVLADRAVWSNILVVTGQHTTGTSPYDEPDSGPDTRNVETVSLQSSCDVYVEDSMRLTPAITARWNRNDWNSGRIWREQWDWGVQLAVTYDLENVLF
jgi:hypothetical protein